MEKVRAKTKYQRQLRKQNAKTVSDKKKYNYRKITDLPRRVRYTRRRKSNSDTL